MLPKECKILLDTEGGNLLSTDGSAMRSPVEIGEGLYAETHYDTETLLKILTARLLTPAGYDYSTVAIVLRNDFSHREE